MKKVMFVLLPVLFFTGFIFALRGQNFNVDKFLYALQNITFASAYDLVIELQDIVQPAIENLSSPNWSTFFDGVLALLQQTLLAPITSLRFLAAILYDLASALSAIFNLFYS